MISISRKNKDKIVQDLQEWFQDNLDQDIGTLDAEFLTDFLQKILEDFITIKHLKMFILLFMRKLSPWQIIYTN